MQLRSMAWMRVALSALGLLGAACDLDMDLSCQSERDCLESELCHPDDQVCVRRCNSANDCFKARPNCQNLSDLNTPKICKA
jgi:hypothetical protein